ncbi:MAG: O-antigen ligase family protein [Rudanella sp.]|nr:O-antigen ligase family protein [Rudanella sp.]
MTNRLILFLFSYGIMACAVSRWRIAGIGPGEMVVGLAALLALCTRRNQDSLSYARQSWQWFVGVSVATMLTGTFWAGSIGVWESVGFGHDALALAFCFISLTLLFPLLADADQRAFFCRQFLRAGIILAISNLVFYGGFQLYLGETTQWIGRFNGLAANPNQLALYVCPLPFYLLQRPFLLKRWETIAGFLACLSVGWLTSSDALLLAWLIGFVGLFMLAIQRRSWRVEPRQNAHMKALVSLIFSLLLSVIIAVFWTYLTDIYAIGGQGNLRFQRWQNGLVALSHSPLFGLGPGAFSGDETAFGGYEAHNLYIDWMASGGVLAGLVLIWLQRRVWLNLVACRAETLLAGFVSLLVFSSFHYVARHPVFWLYHLLFLLNPRPHVRHLRHPEPIH